MDRLCNHEPIDSDERGILAQYIAVMMKRVPANRFRGLQMAPQVVNDVVDEFIHEVESLASSGSLHDAVADRRIDEAERIRRQAEDQLPPGMIEQIESPWPAERKIVAAIRAMSWGLMETTGPCFYIASDNPAFFFSAYGLAHNESEICFPLSSTAALFGHNQFSPGLVFRQARQALVREANRRLASVATRFLFYREPASWLTTIAHKPSPFLSRIMWE